LDEKRKKLILIANLLDRSHISLELNLHEESHNILLLPCIHVRWVACHHGMARPQVADGGDGLQVRRVAVNILNKQSWTADKGWSFSLGVGRGTNNPSP
jgi:hypothetical protein